MKEREMEDRLAARLQQFILELGYGFCFVGRQYRLALGKKEYFVDLLFYHRFLKVLVAFDLKVGAFEPEHAGKMDFYLNLLNEKERAPDDLPSIGIILCAEKDDVEVEFALKTKGTPSEWPNTGSKRISRRSSGVRFPLPNNLRMWCGMHSPPLESHSCLNFGRIFAIQTSKHTNRFMGEISSTAKFTPYRCAVTPGAYSLVARFPMAIHRRLSDKCLKSGLTP